MELNERPEKKKSGRIYAVILFILSCILYLLNSNIIIILLSIGIIAGAIFCFKNKYKFKLFTILALISAGFALFVVCLDVADPSKSGNEDMYAYEDEIEMMNDASLSVQDTQSPTKVNNDDNSMGNKTEQVQKDVQEADAANENETEGSKDVAVQEENKQDVEAAPVEETKAEEKAAVAEEEAPVEEAQETGGVDPDLKAFLDSYEAYIDEYVEFMKKYSSDPNNAIAMLDDYTKMMKRYADFTDKVNKYDTNTMSKADLEYYLDVTNRCSKKLLSVY
ncbi:MAG: hypothetical protein K5877_06695 [Lachnospiraceae bacterium]|nr:hypothetical protein [Lachnospiraceae bacterium]